ncbi:MAG: insulinase family protein [Ignavibacteriaceae bacterium]|nr:insulinase family protein [Ignavibacteriaceae bacterium]
MNGINLTKLPNGLTVLSENIPYIKSFSLGFWLNKGSRDESPDNNGITHLLEHMLFKGTPTRSAKKISEEIELYGGYINAFTSKEHTCFYVRGLDKHFGRSFKVLADMLQNPLFKEKDIKNEISVILDEMADGEDNPDELIFDMFEEQLHRDSKLAFPVIGNEKNVKSISQEVLKDFHSKNFIPENLLVCASGNINHDDLLKLVEKYFKLEQKSKIEQVLTPLPKIEEKFVLQKDFGQIYCITGTKAPGILSNKRLELNILSLILGDGSASRLYQEVREKLGISYQINSFINFYSEVSSFGIYFSTGSEKNTVKVLKVIDNEFKKLKIKEVTPKELQRAKELLKANIILSLESATNRMIRLANLMLNYNRVVPVEEVTAKIDAIQPDQIQVLANEVLNQENFIKVFIKPNSKVIITAA